jgi:hypothetical protein
MAESILQRKVPPAVLNGRCAAWLVSRNNKAEKDLPLSSSVAPKGRGAAQRLDHKVGASQARCRRSSRRYTGTPAIAWR